MASAATPADMGALRPAAGSTHAAPSAPAGVTGIETNWGKLLLGFSGMVIGQFMAILDIQIVAASLSQIQAGVGASADEIAWVQIAYLLAEVVIMPLTAYMTRLWGTQKVFMTCCAAFIGTSVITGLSNDFTFMIVARSLQGLAAGAMIPVVFATAFTAFPVAKRPIANITVGLIVTLAPTIGPTLGGHLTDALSWRWLFFVNVPPGLLAMFLVGRWGNFDRGDPSLKQGIDWWGLIAMTIGLLAIQYVLEEGAEDNWFADDAILWLTVLGILSVGFFIWRQLTYRQPLLNLRLFADRNFSLGMIMTLVSGIALFGGTFILPLYLAQVRRYSAAEVGATMVVSGLAMFMTGPVMRTVLSFLNFRIAIFAGFALSAWAVGLGVHITDDWGFKEFAALQAFRGVGIMIAMIAAQQMTVSTLAPHQMKDASALVNLTRNVGGAAGLAMLSTVLGYMARVHLTELSERMSIANPRSQGMLDHFTQLMINNGLPSPEQAAHKMMGLVLQREALVMAFGDAFLWLAGGSAVAACLAFFAKSPKNPAPPGGGGGDH